ncbi:MAG: dipeptidase PepE, partial [Gemmatimonadaceae bacterium]
FVPYASVIGDWDAYEVHVREAFSAYGVEVESVHRAHNPVDMIRNAEAIAVGGGNTFQLITEIQRNNLVNVIRERALFGTPYVGWSAGSVVACPTMQTTNDMPIAQPQSFQALNLVRFQLNAHFTDVHPAGFQGETRRQRLTEFVTANPQSRVIGLPEGTWLSVNGRSVVLRGASHAPLIRAKEVDSLLQSGAELSGILEPANS